jgi:hypothetical protein
VDHREKLVFQNPLLLNLIMNNRILQSQIQKQRARDAIEREKKTKLQSVQVRYNRAVMDTKTKLIPLQNQKNRIAREEKIIQDEANAKYRILQIEKDRIEAEANLKLSRI